MARSKRGVVRLIALFLSLVPFGARGQGEWEQVFVESQQKMAVYDVLELEGGGYLLSVVSHTSNFTVGLPITRTWLIRLSESGSIVNTAELFVGLDSAVFVPDLIQHPTAGVIAVGMSWFHPNLDGFGIAHVTLSDEGESSGYRFHLLGDGSERLAFHNVSVTQNGDLFIPGSLTTVGAIIPNRLLLARIGASGEDLQFISLGTGSNIRIGHHAVPVPNGMRVSVEGGAFIGPDGLSKLLDFDQNFNLLGGIALPSLGGSGLAFQPDSVLKDCMYIVPLAGDTTLVSGRFGNITLGLRAALARVDPSGMYVDSFLPRSVYQQDHVSAIQGHDLTLDGKVLFAMTENYFPGPPNPEVGTQPSRIRLYRMDTLLNVECEFLVDGFEDNAYYFLTRVKATSDGGAMLIGSRRDLFTMEQPRGWVMKLGPDQCYTGISEVSEQYRADVFPNPGVHEFTLVLNGAPVTGARLDLFNAIGGHHRSLRFDGNTMQIRTEDLPSGLYVYRVNGRDGGLLASGRWVKE